MVPKSEASRQNWVITVVVTDAQSSLPVTPFMYLINENNVGDPQVDVPVPDPSKYPSLKPAASYTPVIATGNNESPSVSMPDGKYFVSVLATGYKIGGNWITVSGGDVSVLVELQPNPLPLSKIRVHVFEDNAPVNGEDDIPLEHGLKDFLIIIKDTIGEVTVDYFGNPLGTEYSCDAFGNPVPILGSGGKILTDENGDAVIENLPPGKYGVEAIPPDGTDWIQTTTIEGTHTIDAWIEEGNDGYSPREGFKAPLIWIGFVKPMGFTFLPPGEGGMIYGQIKTVIEFTPPLWSLVLGEPVYRPWIALSDIGGNDQQVYTGRGDNEGNFVITNVPAGIYQMAIWDEPLDYIIAFRTVQVQPGQIIDMGEIGVPRWYGYIMGQVFLDENENSVPDPGEKGIAYVEVATRFKDGSIQYTTVTDMYGYYQLKEVFELERFAVAEVDFVRYAATGATGTPDYGISLPDSEPRPSETFPGALTLAEITWAAKTNRIDWGKRPYRTGENGGISGMVLYATLRNEFDPRYAMAEDYEPGVPHVTLNLYETEYVNGNITQGALLQSLQSDAWEHPTGCDPSQPTQPCIEVPNFSNQIKPGTYDGGFAFESIPDGEYIVELVPPLGYKLLDENSINTNEGDVFDNPCNTGALQVTSRIAPAPYYGSDRAKKIVTVREGQNAAVDFFIYTDVPAPGRIIGFLLDDVNLETDPNFIYYGEKRGIPSTPVGIRDFTGKLVTTVYSDINGVFEVILPSTYTTNLPTPSGVAPGMYQVIGNDPGDLNNPDPHYNPNYQTLKLVFDVWPGKTTYADVALFPITAFVASPGAQFSQPPGCEVLAGTPQIYHVDRVYVESTGPRDVTITGTDFGNTPGVLTLEQTVVTTTNWSNTVVSFEVPLLPGGPKQLLVRNTDGFTCTTGITIHVFDGSYNPSVIIVPTLTHPTIQSAIDSAVSDTLIVVSPGTYYESPIIYKNIKIQGMGATATTIDGRFFLSYADQWIAKLLAIDFDGPENVSPDQVKEITHGQVVTVVAQTTTFNDPDFKPQLDGFTITGARGEDGGGMYLYAHCHYFTVTNNIIRSNGGGFGGGITVGKAYVGSNYNHKIRIGYNRVANNGGISLAGGIGIFNGADNYEIDYNSICGNYSAEYGGGISHFGLSNNGTIHHNCVLFNSSFDEGAGIFIGGEQPIPPAVLTSGSGQVEIYNNMIKGNVANDDGGGIRLLQCLQYQVNINNNMIVNNVSTDIGGGVALDDSSNVVICNNTIAKNITTATAEDSDGLPHAAGIASEPHSAAFLATNLPVEDPGFSNPVLFNNIIWDNRAGQFDLTLTTCCGGISGIGAPGDPNPVNVIDMEVFGMATFLYPENCLLTTAYPNGSNNQVGDPMFRAAYDTEVVAIAFNMEPDFKSVKLVTVTPLSAGDYHLTADSDKAIDKGTPQVDRTINGVLVVYHAPNVDFDGKVRPNPAPPALYDIGADEYYAGI